MNQRRRLLRCILISNSRINTKFFSFSDYYIGDKGEVCNDASHVIRSEAECGIALQSVRLQVTGKWRIMQKKTIPSGCSINDVGEPFYKKTSTGLGTGRKDLTPICHDSMKLGILNSSMSNLILVNSVIYSFLILNTNYCLVQ